MNLALNRQVRCGGCICLSTLIIVMVGWAVGCSSGRHSREDRFLEFANAGPVRPQVDQARLVRAKTPPDSYRVGVGDVLELHMPAILHSVAAESLGQLDRIEPYLCRVGAEGTITLPIAGDLAVDSNDLPEIEAAVAAAYYPKYVVERPAVIARVAQYQTQPVSVAGAVAQPGVYRLRRDELSLVNLLMKAGGITAEGAGVIRVRHQEDTDEGEPFILPVKGLNIPFADVALRRGDMVEVEPLVPDTFTVIGLVNKPGAFPYPPGSKFNVMQALAFAGGMNDIAAPEYVRIYRQRADGSIIDAEMRIRGSGVTDASSVTIKPGDVVSVEHTVATQTRLLFAQIFRVTFNIGGNYSPWDND